MKLILASTSKFKSQILNTTFLKHETAETNYEENSNETDIYKYVQELALGKAKSVNKEGVILGLDTVCLINGKIVEKPSSIEEAKQNIRNSSNNTISVVTGIALIDGDKVIIDYAETIISFNEISEEDINFYIEHEKDAMYASGFIVETVLSNFIKEIKGSYYNILGVPTEKIYQNLQKLAYNLKDFN